MLVILTNLWLLGSSRLRAASRRRRCRILLGLIPLLATTRRSRPAGGVAAASIVVKAIVLPAMLAERPAKRTSSTGAAAGWLHDVAAVGDRALGPGHASCRAAAGGAACRALLIPVAIFTILSGFLVIASRNTAVMQVIGYLALENGIYIFGWAFAIEDPLLVELGVLLDVFVAVFVMGIMINRLSREFDTIETDELTSLKE